MRAEASPEASPEALWRPGSGDGDTELHRYLTWLRRELGRDVGDYDELWRWSVTDLEAFWGSVWRYFDVRAHRPYTRVLADRTMPGARWFPGALLNYAEHALSTLDDRDVPDDRDAVIAHSQTRPEVRLTFAELRDQVARARCGLLRLGVRPGDRVVGYLPNIPETVIAFLATASIGAIWSTCAPEFGARGALDRLAQLEPRVLLTVTGYRHRDREIDRAAEVAAIRAGLPGLEHVVHVPYAGRPPGDAIPWSQLLAEPGPLEYEPVDFAHPLAVLFSSGTTGVPKAIVHSHGGILLEHLKNHGLSWDLRPGDTMLWFTTTAWMMWYALVSALVRGTTIVLIDGDPRFPDLAMQWRIAQRHAVTHFGASPAYLMACRAAGLNPGSEFDIPLRQLMAAGSPLPPEGYAWVYEQFGPDVLLNVGSGGTDVCSGIVQGGPLLPVWPGEISGRCLGVDAHAVDAEGREVVGEPGELVIRAPMPSMPVGFWNDPGDARYRASYFETFPGLWRHGDWVTFTDRGSAVVTGRADATLNRGGVRLGTAEFYRVVEEVPGIADSLVVHLSGPGSDELLLFVVPAQPDGFDEALRETVRSALRTQLSPRHVPDRIVAVTAIPRTVTGKKLEVPVKQVLLGVPVASVASRDTIANPEALDAFAELSPEFTASGTVSARRR